jgi:probable blue pigment (indigoidine) exporter
VKRGRQFSIAAVAALAPAIWGSTYLVTTEWLPPDQPLLATTVRTLPGGLILLAFARVFPTGKWLWRIMALGTLNIGAFNFLMFVAAYRLPGGVAATLMAMQPMYVLVLAAVLMKDRVRAAHVIACVLGVLGVAMLVFRGETALDAGGVVASLAAAACLALGITLTKYWGLPPGAGLLAGTGWQLTAGGLVSLPFALTIEGLPSELTVDNVIGFSYLILFGAILSYLMWFRGIAKLPALAISILALFSPVVATILGWIVLDQSLTFAQLVGIAVIIGAVVLVQFQATRPKPPAPQSVQKAEEKPAAVE